MTLLFYLSFFFMQKKWIVLSSIVCTISLIGLLPTVFAQHTFSGYQKGISLSQTIGTGKDIIPSYAQDSQGFLLGISTAYMISEENHIQPNFIADDIQFISDINNVLQFNVLAFLNQSSERSESLDIYQEEIQYQYEKVQQRLDILSSQEIATENLLSVYTQQEQQLRNNVQNAIEQKNPQTAEDSLTHYIASQKNTVDAQTKLRTLQIIKGKFTTASTLLAQKHTFIEANRDALIKNVRVVDIRDPSITLIVTKSDWEKNR